MENKLPEPALEPTNPLSADELESLAFWAMTNADIVNEVKDEEMKVTKRLAFIKWLRDTGKLTQ